MADHKTHLTYETLLIAEDDVLVCSSMKKILEDAGYRVIVAFDGEEALAAFREREDISLILSDVVMPNMSGFEFLEEVRRMKPHIRVLFISGYSEGFLKERMLLRDGMELLTKPFSRQDLLRRVSEVLGKR